MQTCEFQIEQTNNLVLVTYMTEQLTRQESENLVEELTQRMRYDGAVFFVLDLEHVKFIDSACIGALVTFLQDLEHVRGRIALANCQPNVAFLFKITRLDEAIRLYEDLQEACREVVHGR